MDNKAIISNVKELGHKNSIALFSMELPSGVIINSCLLRYSDDLRDYTIVPPRIPFVSQENGHLVRNGGNVVYEQAISFRRNETRRHFTHTALTALREQYPHLFTNRRK